MENMPSPELVDYTMDESERNANQSDVANNVTIVHDEQDDLRTTHEYLEMPSIDEYNSPAQKSFESASEPSLSNEPHLIDAIRLFILRSNISIRNVKFLLDLLKIVKNRAIENPELVIPSKNSLIRPPNKTLLEHKPICPVDDCGLSGDMCPKCQKIIDSPNYLSIGNMRSQFTSLIDDKNFMDLVDKQKTKIKASRGLGDVYQGNTYQEFLKQQNENCLTLTLNSDGFVVNSTSKVEPWLIYLVA